MRITEEQYSETITILQIIGRMETETSSIVEAKMQQVMDRGILRLAIDCSGLDYVNSVGLRVLLKAAKKINPSGGAIVLYAMKSNVFEIFDIAGMSAIFPIVDSRDHALERLG